MVAVMSSEIPVFPIEIFGHEREEVIKQTVKSLESWGYSSAVPLEKVVAGVLAVVRLHPIDPRTESYKDPFVNSILLPNASSPSVRVVVTIHPPAGHKVVKPVAYVRAVVRMDTYLGTGELCPLVDVRGASKAHPALVDTGCSPDVVWPAVDPSGADEASINSPAFVTDMNLEFVEDIVVEVANGNSETYPKYR